MSKPIDEWTLEECEARVLIGTDSGTHGNPDTVDVYQRLDGSLQAVYGHGGAVVSREDVHKRDSVTSPGGGRMRWFKAPTPAERQARAAVLRDIARRASRVARHYVETPADRLPFDLVWSVPFGQEGRDVEYAYGGRHPAPAGGWDEGAMWVRVTEGGRARYYVHK